jgi:hypothetical protein
VLGLAVIDGRPTLLIWHQLAMQRRETCGVVLFLLLWRLGATNLDQWLSNRALLLGSVQQHLVRAKQRMKQQADKHRSERSFAVGDKVFLKNLPYVQSSLATRTNQKLSFRFYGPYQILQKVGWLAYLLDLPETAKIHPVVHACLTVETVPWS